MYRHILITGHTPEDETLHGEVLKTTMFEGVVGDTEMYNYDGKYYYGSLECSDYDLIELICREENNLKGERE